MSSETEEMRQQMLRIVDRPLDFPSFTIYSLPGFTDVQLYRGETSVYATKAQDFSFQVTSLDAIDNSIIRGNTFTMSIAGKLFSFRVTDLRPDLEGMMIISCDLEDMSNV